jgi:hypothetical protein
MHIRTIAAVFATLASSTLACDKAKPETTDVPGGAHTSADDSAGEHACGNHADGACGGHSAGPATAVATSRTFEVEPGKFAEANFEMKKGSTVTVGFEKGSGDIAWDVHSHDHSGGTKIHDQGQGGAGSVVFTAPEDGMFSVLWKNGGTTATPLDVSVTLGDGAILHSWIPAE